MKSNIRKDIEGIVEIELKSGKTDLKFTWDAIAYFKEITGENPNNFLIKAGIVSSAGLKEDATAEEKAKHIIEHANIKDIEIILFAALMHTKKFETVEEMKEELLPEYFNDYILSGIAVAGKHIMQSLTKKK